MNGKVSIRELPKSYKYVKIATTTGAILGIAWGVFAIISGIYNAFKISWVYGIPLLASGVLYIILTLLIAGLIFMFLYGISVLVEIRDRLPPTATKKDV